MNFDTLYYPYSSQRKVVFAKNGMVATSQSLAAQAGLAILRQGGNAVDAAIASAACLTVVEPTSNGIGGDAFALVWIKDKLYGLNSSGSAPKSISDELLREKGYQKMPDAGWLPVTVPGIPAAWASLSEKFGHLPFKKVILPAIEYADQGFPVSPTISRLWKLAYLRYFPYKNEEVFRPWFETFAPQDRTPEPGEVWQLKEQAQTLQAIADTNSNEFYQGEIAAKIDAFSRKFNGYLRKEDLTSFAPEWIDPIKIHYHGYEVWEIPPNGQGLVVLMALNILKNSRFTARDTTETFHHQIESIKLAFADGKEYISDSKYIPGNVMNILLSPEYGKKRGKCILDKAIDPHPMKPLGHDTVYLATADAEGNMVSYIQSNYMGFGSGVVIPKTGISLQNRGASFSLDSSHINCLKPGKRSYHTIIPGFLSKKNRVIGPFGVMGGLMQPQGQIQVVMNMIDFQLNPQAALDAPRWQWIEGKRVKVEQEFPKHIAEELERKGHTIEVSMDSGEFGRGQVIWKDHNNTFIGATDPRADGAVVAW